MAQNADDDLPSYEAVIAAERQQMCKPHIPVRDQKIIAGSNNMCTVSGDSQCEQNAHCGSNNRTLSEHTHGLNDTSLGFEPTSSVHTICESQRPPPPTYDAAL